LQIINKNNPWPKGWKQKTSIMGVINLTPDSFSDGGELNSSKKVLDQVNHFLNNGVDVIDLGAQSTRPGAEEVGSCIEIKRLLPYLKLIKSEKIYGSEHNNQRWYTFTVLALSCGLRLAEISGKN